LEEYWKHGVAIQLLRQYNLPQPTTLGLAIHIVTQTIRNTMTIFEKIKAVFDGDSDANSNNEVVNLEQSISDLESQIGAIKLEAASKEESLQDMIKAEKRKSQQYESDLVSAENKRSSINHELENTRLGRQNAETYVEQAEASARDLSGMAVTDRLWLDAEVSRRALIINETSKKSKSDMAQIHRRGTAKW